MVKFCFMNQLRKNQLLEILESEIENARQVAQRKREAAKDFKAASRSQQGDRRMFETTADMAESRLAELLNIRNTIAAAQEIPGQTANPPCYISLDFGHGEKKEFYFVSRGAQLPNLVLITQESPLGQSIIGKKQGEKFTYQIEKTEGKVTFSGKIDKIE